MIYHAPAFLVLLNNLNAVQALAFPQPTLSGHNAHLFNGWTPKPTPAAFIADGNGLMNRDLFRRASSSGAITSTCAYSYTGGGYTALACPGGYGCAYWDYYFACCTLTNGDFADLCSSATACLNYGENSYSGTSKLTMNDLVYWYVAFPSCSGSLVSMYSKL